MIKLETATTIPFELIQKGEYFAQDNGNEIYMKLEDLLINFNCVNVNNGDMCKFYDNEKVVLCYEPNVKLNANNEEMEWRLNNLNLQRKD